MMNIFFTQISNSELYSNFLGVRNWIGSWLHRLSKHELDSYYILTSYIHRAEFEILHVTLQKRDKGQTWSSPIMGECQLDPYTTDLEQKRLMLQRFQEEALISHRLSSMEVALTQGPLWEESILVDDL